MATSTVSTITMPQPGTSSLAPLCISHLQFSSRLPLQRNNCKTSTKFGITSSRSSTILAGSSSSSRKWSSNSGLPRVNRRGSVVGRMSGTAIPWIAAGVGVVVVAVAAGALATTAMAGQGGPQRAILATRQGMQHFAKGDVKGSLEKFDEALVLDPRQLPYLWQRGLSLYYVDRFEEGAEQFRVDVAVNPNDTEESIWCFLCEAQLYGVDEARRRFLVVGPDRRPIMAKIYDLFRYGGSVDKILQLVDGTSGADFFYANLYAGLYHEAHKDQDAAKKAILAAVRSPYGTRSGDYMATLARVHAECRGWKVSSALNI